MKFCQISLIVWIDNFICWIPIFMVPVSIIKPWNLVNHEKAYASTWTREVWSKGAVTWYNFLSQFFFSTCFCQRHFNIGWFPISIWQFEENCNVRTVKKISRMRIKFKSWAVWTLDHSTYLCHRCRIIRKPDS